jgi:hypothetical protein
MKPSERIKQFVKQMELEAGVRSHDYVDKPTRNHGAIVAIIKYLDETYDKTK